MPTIFDDQPRLVLHPQKTKIVYCTDTNRNGRHPVVLFDFLGFTFRPRFTAWPNGKYGVAFCQQRRKMR